MTDLAKSLRDKLTGTAEVVWGGDELKAFDGAERAWRFRVDAGWRLREALPLRWAFRDLSPNSAITAIVFKSLFHFNKRGLSSSVIPSFNDSNISFLLSIW